MKQNHNPWQYASYELLIFDLDLDLHGQIANFITKWQISHLTLPQRLPTIVGEVNNRRQRLPTSSPDKSRDSEIML